MNFSKKLFFLQKKFFYKTKCFLKNSLNFFSYFFWVLSKKIYIFVFSIVNTTKRYAFMIFQNSSLCPLKKCSWSPAKYWPETIFECRFAFLRSKLVNYGMYSKISQFLHNPGIFYYSNNSKKSIFLKIFFLSKLI